MPKRSHVIDTTVMAIELLRRIPRRGRVTAKQLRDQLIAIGIHRDIRTIQRQLDALCRHFDIDRDERSKPYGYSWLEQAAGLAIPDLSTQESLLLALAKVHLHSLLPAPLQKTLQGLFQQANHNLGPNRPDDKPRQWIHKVTVVPATQPLLPPKIQPGVFDAVSTALYENRWLMLRYQNAKGRRQEVQVMPMGLAQQDSRLYLVCRFQGYDNERNLALHRILMARASTLTFTPPEDFDLARYQAEGRFGFGKGQRIRLRFRIDYEAGMHLMETPLCKDQQVEQLEDGRLAVHASVVDSPVLTWWLRGFGKAVSDIAREPLGDP